MYSKICFFGYDIYPVVARSTFGYAQLLTCFDE